MGDLFLKMTLNRLYFDYNATTPVAPEVWRAMEPFYRERFANPSSLHHQGQFVARAIREARKKVAAFLETSSQNEIVFTSGGTESNNAAIRSALASAGNRRKIVTSAVEHSSIRKLCTALKKEGYSIIEIGVDSEGRLDLDGLRESLSDETALVSLMLANNETGVVFPIEEAGRIVKEKGICFHVDAVQGAGKIPLRLKDGAIDLLSLSAHKFYGPKGIGALYVREGVPFKPLLFGGAHERGRRAGTENVPGIIGLAAAAELVVDPQCLHEGCRQMADLRDHFESELRTRNSGVTVNGGRAERLPNTSNLRFEGIDGEGFLFALDQKGICASSGSACMSGAQEPSHVLRAMGCTEDEANASIRFSFGRFTTREEIDSAVALISETLSALRALQPEKTHTPHEMAG